MPKINWTLTDEAPALATRSLLPIVNSFTKLAHIQVITKDISLAGRVLSTFPEYLNSDQIIENDLQTLGDLVQRPEGNIIKLPNISASIPQLKACISELQDQGYAIPNYPETPSSQEEIDIQNKYSTCLGSAVNPVLREGNSDRRAAKAVKKYAQNNPHRLKAFDTSSKAHVAHMDSNDFYGNEQSFIHSGNNKLSIMLETEDGSQINLKDVFAQDKEILDASFMSVKSLREFFRQELKDAKENDVLFSVHLKATMMKVSDPIMYGHCVQTFFQDVFQKNKQTFDKIGINPNLGLSDMLRKLDTLPNLEKDQIMDSINNSIDSNPSLAMVDSDKGITNLHAPNDIIIDASMPVVVRDGGKMWNKDGNLQDCKAVIPDRCYATMYKEILNDCIENGQFDVESMGNVSNVGLMAQKAEEYGSHPTTFEINQDGTIKIMDETGQIFTSHEVEKGDIWRMSTSKDIPIQNWVKLAYDRAHITGNPVIFWLDKNRAHDAILIEKVLEYLPMYNKNNDIEYHILSPKDAMAFTLKRVRNGIDTISATGNVLRDYLTDLFPILELGTSAKMLSIVPLINGGGLFETGAGGSAPKHVDQFLNEGHLRWDSLGEFLALAESLRHINQENGSEELSILIDAIDDANSQYLDNQNSPSRNTGEPGNTTSHYYFAKYVAKALATQEVNVKIANQLKPIAKSLEDSEDIIIKELLSIDGQKRDIGGYFHPDEKMTRALMRPSPTLNSIIDQI